MSAGVIAASYVDAAPATATIYRDVVLADAPLAYYRMGDVSGAITDSSGNGRTGGSASGSATYGAASLLTNESTDPSMDFSGGYVDTPYASWMDTTALTVECWVRVDTGTQRGMVDRDDGSQRVFQWRINTKAEAVVFNSGGSNAGCSGATTLVNGVTYHVAFTYDGTTIRVYVNGVLDGSTAFAGPLAVKTARMAIGVLRAGGGSPVTWPMDGRIDEVAIYGTALSASRLYAHYLAGTSFYAPTVLADAPLTYLRLGGNALDSSGNGRNGVAGNGAYVAGLLTHDTDQAQDNGASSSTSIAGASWMNGLTNLSWEFWFKTSSGGTVALVGRSNAGSFGSADTNQWRAYMVSGQITAQLFNTSWNPLGAVTSPLTYNDNVRHHCVATWNGTTLILYIDGVSVASAAVAGTLPSPATLPIEFGRMASNFPITGTFDEFALYGTALSAARVAAHYLAGSSPYATAVSMDTPSLYWRFNETTGTSGAVIDSSGNARHGDYVNAPTLGVAGLLAGDTNKGLGLDGVNDYAGLASATWMNATTFTVEAWIKTAAGSPVSRVIAARDTGSSDKTWQMSIGAAGTLAAQIYLGASTFTVASTTPLINDGLTHHCVMTLTAGGVLTLYVDGVSVFSQTGVSTSVSGTPTLRVGTARLSGYFPGTIDEFAFWPGVVLSAARIAAHYAAGV